MTNQLQAFHHYDFDNDRCACGGQPVFFEDGDPDGYVAEGCEVADRVWLTARARIDARRLNAYMDGTPALDAVRIDGRYRTDTDREVAVRRLYQQDATRAALEPDHWDCLVDNAIAQVDADERRIEVGVADVCPTCRGTGEWRQLTGTAKCPDCGVEDHGPGCDGPLNCTCDDDAGVVTRCELCSEPLDGRGGGNAEMYLPADPEAPSLIVHAQCGLDRGMEVA